MHHAYTDTEKDPHSPKYFPNLFAMMWHTRNIYAGIFNKKIQPEQQFLKNLPNWVAFDKIANSGISKILWVCAYTAFYIFFAPSAWWFLLLPFTITMGPLHGAIINWFAHKYGYVNFKQKNAPEEFLSEPLSF